MTELAWHYTTGEKFILIADSGELRTTDIHVSPPEKPILWFSTAESWEPTARKMILENGVARLLTMEETREFGRGLFRFGVRTDKLHHWEKLIIKSHILEDIVKGLEIVALEQGSNPNHWYGSTKNISLSHCESIQIMDDYGEWQQLEAD